METKSWTLNPPEGRHALLQCGFWHPPLEKGVEGRDFCLFCSLLQRQSLERAENITGAHKRPGAPRVGMGRGAGLVGKSIDDPCVEGRERLALGADRVVSEGGGGGDVILTFPQPLRSHPATLRFPDEGDQDALTRLIRTNTLVLNS